MKSYTFALSYLLYFIAPASASYQVLSTFIYTHHGERTPLIWGNPQLTPYGARQAYQAGKNFRSKYVQPDSNNSGSVIREISNIFLENTQINILTSTEEWVTSSAQAFMQGLYPPLGEGFNYTVIAGESELANGTNVIAPLNGYQYPNIVAASPYDLHTIFVKGTDNCPQYSLAFQDYWQSALYNNYRTRFQDFYDSLKEPFLNGVFEDSSIGFFDAYWIWDYLEYGNRHNVTVNRRLNDNGTQLIEAQLLADNWMFDMYANTSTTGDIGPQHIRAIAGRTLAYDIIQSFATSIQYQGKQNKMNLRFGDYKPMMGLFAAMKLMTPQDTTFYNAPLPGSSIVFELYTLSSDPVIQQYPKSTDMYVRFSYQSSTETPFAPQEYGLFGLSTSATLTWGDFVSAMGNVMISNVADWCTTCGSSAVFCTSSTDANQSSSNKRGGLAPAVAGVVGAIAALVFIGLVVALVMFFGGIRFYRRNKSELGGFKGSEKLASDRDLTIPKGGAGVSVQEEPRGHERVGSWELREPASLQKTHSGIDTAAFGRHGHGLDSDDTTVDPYGVPVKPRDTF